MGKNSLKSILSILVAIIMSLCTPAALAKGKPAADPAAAIGKLVKAPAADDLCLPEAYVAFLNEQGIPIVEGNVTPQTVEQFVAIASYYHDYLKGLGIEVTQKKVNDFLLSYNIDSIPDALGQALIDAKAISSPLWNFQSGNTLETNKLIGYMIDKAQAAVVSRSIDLFPVRAIVINNLKSRQCMSYIESFDKAFISAEDRKSKTFVIMQEDVANFLLGKKSTFPYPISELGAYAHYYGYGIASTYMGLVSGGDGILAVKLGSLMFDQSYIDSIAATVGLYVDSFPAKPALPVAK